jgi:hypothetical protein
MDSSSKAPEDIQAMLARLQSKYQENADKISPEDKLIHCEMLQNVIERVGVMRDSVRRSMRDLDRACDTDGHDNLTVKVKGQFLVDLEGSLIIPSVQDFNNAFRAKPSMGLSDVTVVSVTSERNFTYLLSGPSSENYLLQEEEVFIRLESVDQKRLITSKGRSRDGSLINSVVVPIKEQGVAYTRVYTFTVPSFNTRTRTGFRAIGDLLVRLRNVDAQLKGLGAVPSPMNGMPELDHTLVQAESFDRDVKEYQCKMAESCLIEKRPGIVGIFDSSRQSLHRLLVSFTRVDKRKRQAALDPLIDERIEILLKLSQYDPDDFPVVVERAFK